MDDNDITKELPAVTRQNRIEWLASPDGHETLKRRINTLAHRMWQAMNGQTRLICEDRDHETLEAAAMALKVAFGKGK